MLRNTFKSIESVHKGKRDSLFLLSLFSVCRRRFQAAGGSSRTRGRKKKKSLPFPPTPVPFSGSLSSVALVYTGIALPRNLSLSLFLEVVSTIVCKQSLPLLPFLGPHLADVFFFWLLSPLSLSLSLFCLKKPCECCISGSSEGVEERDENAG